MQQKLLIKKGWILVLFLIYGSMVNAVAQSTTIKGKVTDATGAGLPGASVLLKGTTVASSTDVDGNYSLTSQSGSGTLVVSYIGFLTKEVAINNQTTINVALQSDAESLDEVVVVGYGTQRKSDITGSVAVVDAEETKKFATSDVSQLLQGRASGVAVTTDGQPGAAPSVRIRGVSTFGAAGPLYVIDGVPVGTSPRDFNPNDVESIQVLKDASAAAIYGSRAANGVVIITTKQGRKNTPLRVEYSGYYGVDKVWKRIPVADRVGYQTLNNESQLNGGQTVAPGNDPNSPVYIDDVDTDWQKEGLKTGSRQNHNLNLSGGGENITYNVALDYFGQDGTFVGNGPSYDRYSARINTTGEKGRFRFGTNLYYTSSHENTLTYRTDVLTGNRPPLIGDLLMAIPTMRVYDPSREGGFGGIRSDVERAIVLNAVGANKLFENYTDVDRTFGVAWGEVEILKGLKYKLNVSYDKTVAQDYAFQPTFDFGFFFNSFRSAGGVTQNVSRLSNATRNFTTGLVENTLNYEKTFDKHSVALLVGQMYQSGTTKVMGGSSELLPKPYYPVLDNGTNNSSWGNKSEWGLASYLGRLNYSFNDKYLVTATLRRDASSRFAPQNRVGYFPSVALGWKLTNEEFLNLPEAITELKLRGSYGRLGNQDIGDYLYYPVINPNIVYNFNGSKVVGGLQTSLISEDIKWESKTSSNVGLDATLFNGLVDFSAEYYSNKSTDVLVGVPIPSSTGSVNTAPVINAATLRNTGIELNATYHGSKGAFTYDINGNFSTLKNRVLALGGNNEPIYGVGSKTEVGGEIGRHFGWVTDGIFQTQEEVANHAFQSAATSPGDLRFKDLNDDGVINAEDRTYLGSGLPSVYYGMNFTAGYKGFDVSLFVSGAAGYQINSRTYRELMHTQDYMNYHEDAFNRWTPTNTNTDVPRLAGGDPNDNNRDSDREGWLQDGKHLRINTLSIGYNLPEGFLKGISKARVYVTGQNLHTFQAYKLYNPDFTSGVFNPGFDGSSYPRPRTLMLGVQVGF
ncbi:SusC/RagA family TonB-linked outer membrane protein [Rufibacter latericius]|uniref:TonB-dependent receptor n=1 Tax=Rufibacter latericius TaxID=2487040 RepID=A0A3M9ML45_9BACT|nr:TonB-dependent receptor [Rufibacter latericius]RNI26246.1 TonB-dependent receptor [Rufibacter latericius]